MTRKIIIFLLVLGFAHYTAYSQKEQIEIIKKSDKYIWGFSQSDNPEKADKNALEDLLTKISVRVESSFEYVTEESTEGGFHEYSKSVVQTYSDASLTNVNELGYEKHNIFYILRYIKKTELQKAFDLREDKIRTYINVGTIAQREFRMGDALRNYYYAYALYLTHPYQNELKTKVESEEVLMGILLRDRISSLLTKIKFDFKNINKIAEGDKSKILLECTYNGHPIENLVYKFHNGKGLSHPQEVLSGKSEIILYGAEQTELVNLNIYVEYKYEDKAIHDKELSKVLAIVNTNTFSNHKTVVIPQKKAKQQKTKKLIKPSFASLNNIDGSQVFYKKTVNNLLIAIEEKDYPTAYSYLTDNGKNMFDKLIKYGRVSVLPLDDTLKIIQLEGETVVRSVPMSFYFPNSRKRFMENVVFTFNNETQKVDAISFAISDRSIFDITNHSEKFGSIEDKYTLIKFMEYYKTAYSLKRLDYIESIFADEALIIVGTVLQRSKPIDDMYNDIGEKEVKYQRYTKKEYIDRLQNVFNSKDYINLEFDEAVVKKVNGPRKIYGIQIAQSYNSDNYADFGYLFLMIDLNDSLNNPLIYVRTWQPQKTSDGNIYGLSDFRMD